MAQDARTDLVTAAIQGLAAKQAGLSRIMDVTVPNNKGKSSAAAEAGLSERQAKTARGIAEANPACAWGRPVQY